MLKTRKVFLLVTAITLFLSVPSVSAELTAEKIMEKVDENQFISSARMESKMIIEQGNRKRTLEMITYTQSNGEYTEALTEFTAPPRERGTKYLMRGDDLWMFFPDAENVVPISGHMLREGMMGSDFSYKDVLESSKLTEQYNFELKKQETIDGRDAYVITGIAQEDANVLYYERKIWIDSERFVVLKEELYSASGRLLKVMEVTAVQEMEDGRYFPVEMVMQDKLRDNTSTTFQLIDVEFDIDIPDETFSQDALS